MNNKSISLFNYIYSNSYEEEKNDDIKWKEFEKICLEKKKYTAYDFVLENENLLIYNKKNMWQDILGNKEITGKFLILNFIGQKEFLNYKVNELISIINNYGKETFKNLENIFEFMCNEAIKEILIETRNKGLIEFDNNIFMYASDRLYDIFYDNIKILINKKDDSVDNLVINNNGNMINQIGNGNNAQLTNIDEEKLFLFLSEKFEALKVEMQNKNCEETINELEKAMKKKDKKSALEILSQLASIGSFIATGISMFT